MITRDAIYDFLDDVITASGPSDALYGAVLFRNLRDRVDAVKVVRVDVVTGTFVPASEPKLSEADVQCTIQFHCLPDDVEEASMDDAVDISFNMMTQAAEAIAADPSLSGEVCSSYFAEWQTGYENIGATRYGVTWLDGVINQER